ncbi:efflux RND transporter periplasmic adaptor subunit [bacterium]|nr:efflux RND transporter periplasmic adaptor subunit [bacterium]
MFKRILVVAALAAVMATFLIFSQHRREPLMVSGFVEAYEIRVGSRVGGRIAGVEVNEGDRITSGTVLVRLDPFDLYRQRERAKAQYESAKAAYERVVNGSRPEEIEQGRARYDQAKAHLNELVNGPRPQEIAGARAQLAEAEAQLALAMVTFTRVNSLSKDGVASIEQLDQARATRDAARATVESRRQSLELLLIGTRIEQIQQGRAQLADTSQTLRLLVIGPRAEDIAAAKANAEAAAANLRVIEKQIDELTIRAMLPGIVEAVDLRPGDLIAQDAPALSIMDTSQMWVRAYVPESRLTFGVGDAATVTTDSFPGEKFSGTVTFIARQGEFTPNNVQTPEDRSKVVLRIKVQLTSGLDKLRPGMAADVHLPERPRR